MRRDNSRAACADFWLCRHTERLPSDHRKNKRRVFLAIAGKNFPQTARPTVWDEEKARFDLIAREDFSQRVGQRSSKVLKNTSTEVRLRWNLKQEELAVSLRRVSVLSRIGRKEEQNRVGGNGKPWERGIYSATFPTCALNAGMNSALLSISPNHTHRTCRHCSILTFQLA